MNTKLRGWAESSIDPQQLSMTVHGGLVVIVGLITYIASTFFHVAIGGIDLTALTGFIVGLIGAVKGLYGLLRKITVTKNLQ